jgi:hypothetical protein
VVVSGQFFFSACCVVPLKEKEKKRLWILLKGYEYH